MSEVTPAPLFPGTPLERRVGILLLILIASMAAALRFWDIGAENLWLDEVYTLQFSTGRGSVDFTLPRNTIIADPPRPTSLADAPGPWSVWKTLKDDTHPPLYYLIVRGWRVVFGDSPAALRGFSAIVSTLAVVIVFAIGWAHFGSMASGAWAAALMRIAVPQIVYAREGRDYALLVAMSVLAVWSIVWIERRGASIGRLSFVAVSFLLAMLTHYYCAGVVIALGLYALIRFRHGMLWRTIGAMFVAGLVYAIIWGPFLWEQRTTFSTMNPRPDDPVGHAARTIVRLIELPVLHFIGSPVEMTTEIGALMLAAIAIAALIHRRRAWLLPGLWIAVTVGIVLAVDLMNTSRQLSFVRYTLAAAPALFLLIGDGLGIRTIARHIPPAIALAATWFFVPAAYTHWRADGTPMAQYLDSAAQPDDMIIFHGGERGGRSAAWVWLVMSHCRQTSNPIVILDDPIPPSLLAQLNNTGQLFLATDTFAVSPAELLPDAKVVESLVVPRFGSVSRLHFGPE